MVQIVLIRPCSTNYDEQGRIQGTLDIPLSPQGSAKAQQLGDELRKLGISAIYTAPCEAAWQTGSIVGQSLGARVKKIEGLQNLDHGLWQGMLVEDIRRKHPKVYRQWQEQPQIICPPEGEMLGECQQRMKSVLIKLLRKHKTGALGLVLPEPLASLVQAFLTNTDVGDLWKPAGVCGSWELIKLDAPPLYHRGIEVKGEKNADPSGVLPIGLN